MTNQEMRQLAASMDLQGIRKECGIPGVRIARALGVAPDIVSVLERGLRPPQGTLGARYMRIMTALRNHLEVTVALMAEERADREAS